MVASEVYFRDLEFDHAFRLCRNRDGTTTQRWVPIEMPRISAALQRSVFFLFQHHPVSGQLDGPGATGFLVSRWDKGLLNHVYAVSNRHAIVPYSIIRVNTKVGGVRFIEFDPAEWVYSETDDLAVVDVTDHLRADDMVSCIKESSFASSRPSAMDARIGDQTIMLGLFADYQGGAANVPVGRFGNLAARPSQAAPVRLSSTDRFVRPAFLNDMRSRTGFSGSPVWSWYSVYQDVAIDSVNVPDPTEEPRRHSTLKLIGIHRGQFREAASPLTEPSQEVEIASSTTVVIPAWEISKVLDLPILAEQRAVRDQRPDRIKQHQEALRGFRSLEKES